MRKDKKIRFNENSRLLVRKIIARGKDNHGRDVIKTQWFVVDKEFNLGSLSKKQNEDIVQIKYEIPDPNKKNIFESLFG